MIILCLENGLTLLTQREDIISYPLSFLLRLKLCRNTPSSTATTPTGPAGGKEAPRLDYTLHWPQPASPIISVWLRTEAEIRIEGSPTLQVCILSDHKIVLPIVFAFTALWGEENKMKRNWEVVTEGIVGVPKGPQSVIVEICICVQNKTILANINERSFEGTVPWHLAGYNWIFSGADL